MQIITVVSHPRTGSNFFFDTLASCTGVLPLFEIFHDIEGDRGAWEEPLQINFSSFEEFNAAKNEDPIAVIRTLTADAQGDIAVLKVFPNHLSQTAFRKLIAGSSGVIQLTRNPFSSWVSSQIALKTNTWSGADTNEQKVAWSALSFATWVDEQLTHILLGQHIAEDLDRSIVALRYEDLIAATSSYQVWEYLRNRISTLPRYTPVKSWAPSFRKQDSRVPIERITNRSQAIFDLGTFGLESLVTDRALTQVLDVLPRVSLMRSVFESTEELIPIALQESLFQFDIPA